MTSQSPEPVPDAPRSCGEALIELLEQRGVELVFGIPGVHTLELYRGLAGSSIRHITPRHEQGAAFMADGYARVARRPGVCLLITGAGVTNAATAVASAYHDSEPLLVISSATDSRHVGRRRATLHELPDQQGLMASITGSAETVQSPAQIAGALERAFAVLEAPRPRPAHIGVPIDVLAQPAASPAPGPGRGEPSPARASEAAPAPAGEPRSLELAAELLAGARSPMIVLGGGAVDAGAEALRVAAAVGAPIATTINGKGAIPESHPVALGVTLSLEPVYGALQHADVVLAVGTELSEVDFGYQPDLPHFDGALIRIDRDPAQLVSWQAPTVALLADARAALGALADRLEDGGGSRLPVAADRAAELAAGLQWWAGAERFFAMLDAIEAALPADAIVVCDSTQPAYVAESYLRAERPRSFLAPAGFGTLGPALPMAIGAKLAAPQRPVVCLAGDGGLLFTIAELATAAAHRIPVVLLVYNNNGYGEIRDSMDRIGVPWIGTDGSAADYLKLAEGFGCVGERIRSLSEIAPAVELACVREVPTLIELPGELAR